MKNALETSPGKHNVGRKLREYVRGDDGGSAAYYRQKYKALKRKLRLLVYEQECFIEELKNTQRKLLKVSRDKSFLLDRLLQLETLDESSSDSEATASSDSDHEEHRKMSVKRRKRPISFVELPSMNEATAALLAKMSGESAAEKPGTHKAEQKNDMGPTPKKRSKTTTKKDRSRSKKSSHPSSRSSSTDHTVYTGMLSREEVERQLDAKKPVMGIEKAQATLPIDIFNDDNSLQHGESNDK